MQTSVGHRWQALGLVVLAGVIYFPVINGEMLWDDDVHISRNVNVTDPKGIFRIWLPLAQGADTQYFPMSASLFWLQHQLWSDWTVGYHLVNIGIHALNGWLLYCLLLRLHSPGAALAAVIFVLHPSQVESVAWISEQKNTLAAMFYLWTLLFWLRLHEQPANRRAAAVLALAFCALATKATAVALPFVMIICRWLQARQFSRLDRWVIGLVFGLCLFYGSATAWVEHNLMKPASAPHRLARNIPPWGKPLLVGKTTWFYLGQLCWPQDYISVYPKDVIDPTSLRQYCPLLAVIGVSVGIAIISRRVGPALALAWLVYLLNLAPTSGLIDFTYLSQAWVADHYQYFAAPAIFTMMGWIGARLTQRWRWTVVVVGLLTAAWSLQSCRYSRVFAHKQDYYSYTLRRNPNAVAFLTNMGLALTADPIRTEEAETYFRKALTLQPENAHAMIGLAELCYRRDDNAEAKRLLEQALKIRESSSAWLNLGQIAITENDLETASFCVKKATPLTPKDAALLDLQANVASGYKRYAEAVTHHQQALRLEPDNPHLLFNYASTLMQMGHDAEAEVILQRLLRRQPDDHGARHRLALVLSRLGHKEAALREFALAHQQAPAAIELLTDFAALLEDVGQRAQALRLLERACQQLPADPQPYYQYALFAARIGDRSLAERLAQQALRLAKARPDPAMQIKIELFFVDLAKTDS